MLLLLLALPDCSCESLQCSESIFQLNSAVELHVLVPQSSEMLLPLLGISMYAQIITYMHVCMYVCIYIYTYIYICHTFPIGAPGIYVIVISPPEEVRHAYLTVPQLQLQSIASPIVIEVR